MKALRSTLLVAILLLASHSAFAQTSDSDDATISAEVLAVINVTVDENIDFGLISPDISTDEPLIDPANAGNDANVAGTQTAGRFHIEGTDGQDILFAASNFTDIDVISDTDNDYAFSFSPDLYGVAGSLSALARGTGGATLTGGGTGTLTSGEYTVWVGGTLNTPVDDFQTTGTNATTALVAGDYSGTYTLTIDYD